MNHRRTINGYVIPGPYPELDNSVMRRMDMVCDSVDCGDLECGECICGGVYDPAIVAAFLRWESESKQQEAK